MEDHPMGAWMVPFPSQTKGISLLQAAAQGGRPMCGRSGLLLEAWDVQTWGQSGRLGEVWKSERSALESMSLVFGLDCDFQRQRMLQNRGIEHFWPEKKASRLDFRAFKSQTKARTSGFRRSSLEGHKCRKQASTGCSSQKIQEV